MSKEWKATGSGNLTLAGEGFYISFRGDARKGGPENPLLEVTNTLGGIFGINTGETETALHVRGSDQGWRILNGDFRAEYEAAYPSLEACIAVYEKHKNDCRSDWSTDEVSEEA
jgi:hypothetical protein